MDFKKSIEELLTESNIPPDKRDLIRAMIQQLLISNQTIVADGPNRKILTIMGSAREKETSFLFKLAYELGRIAAVAGFDIMSGGGPGIMEAANRGALASCPASLCDIRSIGLNLLAPSIWEQSRNQFQTHPVFHGDFATRLWTFFSSTQGAFLFPGGLGTELEEAYGLNSQQCGLHMEVPLILVDSEFWSPKLAMFQKMKEGGYIDERDQRFLDRVLISFTVTPTEDPEFIRQQAESLLALVVNWTPAQD